jgi:D-3-phosphoglycerate dehydrogenase / 2-oxoglutarate reductase
MTGQLIKRLFIVSLDSCTQVCVEIFKERGHQVDYKVGLPKDELIKIIGQYDGLVVRSATKVTKDVIEAADRLVVIGRAGRSTSSLQSIPVAHNGKWMPPAVKRRPGGRLPLPCLNQRFHNMLRPTPTGVGVDNIDLVAATKKGVMVMNTPGGNTVSTAQLAFSLLTSSARSLPHGDASLKAGKWER